MFNARQWVPPKRPYPTVPPMTWPWPERREADIREDQTRRIVEWLQGRTGAHGGGFASADDVALAIKREFGTYEPGSD